MSKVETFNNVVNSLGEGCKVSSCGNYVGWVDIETKEVFLSTIDENIPQVFRLDTIPSCIFDINSKSITLLDDKGITSIDRKDGSSKRLVLIDALDSDSSMRGNDGILVNDVYYFGTMKKEPTLGNGSLYYLKNGNVSEFDTCKIPNTFLPITDGILISDSSERVIYKYSFNSFRKEIWCDLSSTNMTPDGGCIVNENRIFICMWGAACVAEFDLEGSIIKKYHLPAQNPTNCCVFKGKIFITSASIEVRSELPSSKDGHSFLLEV